MLRKFWDSINYLICATFLLDYRLVVIGICVYWFWFTSEVPILIDSSVIKDIYSLIATTMATLLGLFIAILVIAMGYKGQIAFEIINFEGLLQNGLWLFWSLLFSMMGYMYSAISKQDQSKIVVFIVVFFAMIAILRLLELTRTTIKVILQENKFKDKLSK